VWGHFFRREWLEAHRIRFHDTNFHEDEEFLVKACFHAGKMLLTPHKAYAYSCRSPHPFPSEEHRMQRMQAFSEMLLRLKAFRDGVCTVTPQPDIRAIDRRIRFLTIDCIRQMRRNRCSLKEAVRRLSVLKQEGLLPLPHGSYGWKYRLAAAVINACTHLLT